MTVRRAEYVALALEVGLDIKAAMLEPMRTVYTICQMRAQAHKEARRNA